MWSLSARLPLPSQTVFPSTHSGCVHPGVQVSLSLFSKIPSSCGTNPWPVMMIWAVVERASLCATAGYLAMAWALYRSEFSDKLMKVRGRSFWTEWPGERIYCCCSKGSNSLWTDWPGEHIFCCCSKANTSQLRRGGGKNAVGGESRDGNVRSTSVVCVSASCVVRVSFPPFSLQTRRARCAVLCARSLRERWMSECSVCVSTRYSL